MKTLLIVEDEKMIRQGIRTMAQRSGVPIDVIMECNNGEAALEILKEQQIDVMFTDIRMPKMDGIELVQRASELENPPLMVAISGYDDFSYAVEMLRNGVREYILKPVDRDKIKEVLEKLNDEVEKKVESVNNDRSYGKQQMKYLLANKEITPDEIALLKKKYDDYFYQGEFAICCCAPDIEIEENESVIVLNDVDEGCVCVISEESLEAFMRNEISNLAAGISTKHRGIEELQKAYSEAIDARRKAFCTGETVVYGQIEKDIPAGLKENAKKLLDENSCMQRLQLIGTNKTDEIDLQWDKLFTEVEKLRIKPEHFFIKMEEFLQGVLKIYRNAITDEDKKRLDQFYKFLQYNCLEDYREDLMEWIIDLHDKINNSEDSNGNQQKIKMAIEYIEDNYDSDLNMAVVSNYISMNYSLFSFSFKQYTGTNFVNYLKAIRMKKAKELLAETDMKVVEISQSVGYDNEKHFMKTFKNECGVSPTEYRKNMKNGAV